MITYIAHMRVTPENAAAYEEALAEMARQVAIHEPDVVHYQLSKSTDDPELYVVIEIYRDEAAFEAHWQTDFIRPLAARTAPLMVPGSLQVKRYVSA